MRAVALFVVTSLLVFGCSGAPSSSSDDPALLDVWGGMESGAVESQAASGTPCSDSFGTWFDDFGVRGLACVASFVVDPVEIAARSGVDVFVQSPHRVTSESFVLNLNAERDFGHYNPAFVDWLMENGVVGANNPAVRALTQSVYDHYLKQLARVYWVTYEDMAADGYPRSAPAGPLSDYANFLDGGPIPDGAEGYEGGFSVYAFTDLSEGLLSRLDLNLMNDWEAKYELNTAYGFWLRRRADETQSIWRDGLVRLLETYDAEWFEGRG